MSGAITRTSKASRLDTLDERYEKVRQVCDKMLVLQVGLCCVSGGQDGQPWVAKPMSFVVFPQDARSERHYWCGPSPWQCGPR